MTLAEAVEAHRAGELEAALALYLAVLEESPNAAAVHNNVAAIQLRSGDVRAAKRHWMLAIAADPAYAEPLFNLAVALSEHEGNHKGALVFVRRALALKPSYVAARHLLGNLLQDAGDDDGAREQFALAEGRASAEAAAPRPAGEALSRLDGLRPGAEQAFDLGRHGTVRATTLSVAPLVLLVRNFLSADECARIVELARGRVRPSVVTGGATASGAWRSSESAYIQTSDDALLRDVQARLTALARLPAGVSARSEALQVVRYAAGGEFRLHHDSSAMQPRALTALYYLNGSRGDGGGEGEGGDGGDGGGGGDGSSRGAGGAFEGGETVFPAANGALSQHDAAELLRQLGGTPAEQQAAAARAAALSGGVRVSPELGSCLLFYNHLSDALEAGEGGGGGAGGRDALALHAGLPVRCGEKWVANHFVSCWK
jgi:prolyl 4-hydroxylase